MRRKVPGDKELFNQREKSIVKSYVQRSKLGRLTTCFPFQHLTDEPLEETDKRSMRFYEILHLLSTSDKFG